MIGWTGLGSVPMSTAYPDALLVMYSGTDIGRIELTDTGTPVEIKRDGHVVYPWDATINNSYRIGVIKYFSSYNTAWEDRPPLRCYYVYKDSRMSL